MQDFIVEVFGSKIETSRRVFSIGWFQNIL